MSLLYDGTSESMAEIAEFICEQFAAGAHTGTISLNNVAFDMDAQAMCSYFVHRCAWAACGHDIPADFGGNARQTEQDMIAAHIQIAVPVRGACVMFNRGKAGTWGHTGVDLGDGEHYAENTSSTSRGPGFVVSRYDQIGRDRISGYYRVLPPRGTLPLKIVSNATGQEVPCAPLVVGNRMTARALTLLTAMGVSPKDVAPGAIHADSLRCYVTDLMPYCKGWTYKYERTEQGPRVYLKPPGS